MISGKGIISSLVLSILLLNSYSQNLGHIAEKIRVKYNIPELGYSIVSADSVYELQVTGYKNIQTPAKADLQDRFRIGSNTKAITGFLAAIFVKQGKLSWDTKFFDLFPELKTESDSAYYDMTLIQMVTMRTSLPGYSYTNEEPHQEQFIGNKREQRLQFFAWMLRQPPVIKPGLNMTNLGFVGAGLMLEKTSNMTYEDLVNNLGNELKIKFGFGNPNFEDSTQPWGHNAQLTPEAPANNYKLNWLLSAGNINVSLPDYAKFIQMELSGIAGHSSLLSQEEFRLLLLGFQAFSAGWYVEEQADGSKIAYNIGNPGTFYSVVHVEPGIDKAFIIFANAQTPKSEKGVSVLLSKMKKKYRK